VDASERIVADRYELLDRIGEGGFGAVWRAKRLSDGALVAIKLIRPEIVDERSLSRFQREAELSRSIHHANVVEVLDHGTHEGRPYLVMELLEGESLEARLEKLPPPTVAELAQWMRGALAGLSAVHARGIVHRDLKPGNLFLTKTGDAITVKVLDFGLSRSVLGSLDGSPLPSLTRTHQFLGTPFYVSPEQVRSAKRIDARSDLFSVGVVLYEALAGRRPFDGENAAAVIAALVADEPPLLESLRPDLPRSLSSLVSRALSKDANERFANAEEMIAALDKVKGNLAAVRATPRDMARVSPVPLDGAPDPIVRSRRSTRPPASRASTLWFVIVALFLLGGGASALAFGLTFQGDKVPEVEVRPSSMPDAGVTRGRSVVELGPKGTLSEVAFRVMRLSPDDRRSVRVAPRGDSKYALVSATELEPDEVAELTSTLGVDARPIDAMEPAGLTPTIARTTVSLNLRTRPTTEDSEVVRIFPRGALVVALLGALEGDTSELAGRGTWAWVVPNDREGGWSASVFLEEHSGCVPIYRGDGPAPVTSLARLYRNGLGFEAAIATVSGEHRSRVEFHKRDVDCGLELDSALTLPGYVEDFLLTTTTETGGDTLAIVAWRTTSSARDEQIWNAFRLGDTEPRWEARLLSHPELGRRAVMLSTGVRRSALGVPGWWPLVTRSPDGRRDAYRWSGQTLVRDPEASLSANGPGVVP
jgi:hypothetical protein